MGAECQTPKAEAEVHLTRDSRPQYRERLVVAFGFGANFGAIMRSHGEFGGADVGGTSHLSQYATRGKRANANQSKRFILSL